MLAHGFERLLADARRPPRSLTARIPVQRDQVLAAAPEIERLIDHLHDLARPIDEHVMRAARDLLRDGAGPSVMRAEPGALLRRVRRIVDAVE